jgi:hypothetical protein
MADPTLTDSENYKEGIELHRKGKYADAYEFYFKDLTPGPRTRRWLDEYKAKYVDAVPSEVPSLPPSYQPDQALPSVRTGSSSAAGTGPRVGQTILILSGGLALPFSPDTFTEYWNSGGGFGIGVGYKMTRITTLLFEIHHSRMSLDEDAMLEHLFWYPVTGARLSGGSFNFTTFLMNARLQFTGSDAPVKPYFIGGLGYGYVLLEDLDVSYGGSRETLEGDSETDLAIRMGFGVDLRLSRSAFLFFETNGITVSTEGDSTGFNRLETGLRFDFGGRTLPGR